MAHATRTFGILTGGGDCPGLNAVLRAAARQCARRGAGLLGYRNGWEGVIAGDSVVLDRRAVKGILPMGGTILGTSRTDPIRVRDGIERMRRVLTVDGVEGMIAVGGDGTLSAANELAAHGFHVIGVPKTIDNDLSGTDVSFGFDTAVNVAMEAIDRLHSTAEAHKRVIVIELMGRHVGWIAAHAGIAGGADVVLVPEYPFSIDAVCERIRERERRGRRFSIVVVAEGARPSDEEGAPPDNGAPIRPGEMSAWLAREIEECIDTETRTVVLGHVQRGGTPSAADRVLATRFGVRAVDNAFAGEWGGMVALNGSRVTTVSLGDAVRQPKVVSSEIWEIVKTFA